MLGWPSGRARLRNQSGLESALARPLWQAHYNSADIAMQAAVLAHGIAEGQLFIDGNKRTALASLRLFLLANGYDINASQADRASWIIDLAGQLSVEGLADKLRTAIIAVDQR